MPQTIYAGQILTADLLNGVASTFPSQIINVTDYGTYGDGIHDDTAALQAAIDAAMAAQANAIAGGVNSGSLDLAGIGAGTVLIPDGVYLVSEPLQIKSSSGYAATGITLLGFAGPGGSGSGSGCGIISAGSVTNPPLWTPGTAGSITETLLTGPVIATSSSWSQGSASAPAVIIVDGTGGKFERVTISGLTIYGGATGGSLGFHGICGYGSGNGLKISNCVICVLLNGSSKGIYNCPDSSYNNPDGTTIEDCMIQFVGGDGVHGSFGDAFMTNVHVQQCGSYGFYISNADQDTYVDGSGANTRLVNCRADLNGSDGFFVSVSTSTDRTGITLSNCGTQENAGNGIHITHPGTATLSNPVAPVYCSSCVFQGDGTTGGASGINVTGPAFASFASCGVHVSDNIALSPTYGISTFSNDSEAPQVVQFSGGFLNGVNDSINSSSAPASANFLTSYYTGGMVGPSSSISSFSYSGSALPSH